MSVTDGALVQVAFYGGYFAMAFPAAMFIRKYSYKAGILLGLGLYAVGALLFFPAKMTGSYYPVSYTHLDVYKRQIQFHRCTGISLYAALTFAGIEITKKFLTKHIKGDYNIIYLYHLLLN